ncbi:hypothetical protein [Streptomyces sp. NBRC 110028]|uniref:hypothetical protein n=1 Tax=Streptomyces sp. NBRC 110028 TaxID=1621260 RepID=UPI001F3AFDFD|nr:hypothetical protein [Streptomyces sp. NBRC 110028]
MTRGDAMKHRSRDRAGLTAVTALCAVATMAVQIPVAAADSPAGAREYRVQGTPVQGSGSGAGAPSLRPGRTYADSLGPGEKRFYGVDLDAKSTAYVSAVAAPRPGAGVVSYRDGVTVTLKNPAGGVCGTVPRRIETKGVAYPLADYVTRQTGSGSVASCRTAGRYLVTVERQAGSADPDSWPLELRLMVEPPVKGGSTGPAPEGSWHTKPPQPPSGGPRPRQGGQGFSDAPLVSTGVWRDDFEPGETHFYRVPVDWGQQISAIAELPADAADKSTGPLGQAVAMRAYNPARGLAKRGTALAQESERPRTEVSTAPAAYGNRYAKSDYSVRAMSLTGGYYLAVTVNPPNVEPHLDGTVPMTLRVRVAGQARGGPAYDGNAVKAGFGLTDAEKREARKAASPLQPEPMGRRPGAEDRDTLQAVAYTSFGTGSLLLIGLGAWILTARRRTAAEGPRGGPGGDPDAADPTTGQHRYGPPPAW